MAASGSGMQGSPLLTVFCVHIGTKLDKQLHHLFVVIYAALPTKNSGIKTESWQEGKAKYGGGLLTISIPEQFYLKTALDEGPKYRIRYSYGQIRLVL